MGTQNKAVALLLAVLFICSAFFTTTASAKEVNTSLAASPMATISAIDDIGTPLSNQEAGEVRGEFLYLPAAMLFAGVAWEVVYYYSVRYGVAQVALWIANSNPTGATASSVRAIEVAIKSHFGW